MDDKARNLVLASEIAGLLHDLGKLRPEFAEENFRQGESQRSKLRGLQIYAAHGAILEESRPYPSPTEDEWLAKLRRHDGWRDTLRIPPEWLQPDTADKVQAHGLGDPLREHHGQKLPDYTLLGTLFSAGADIRDSALDKSGEGKGAGQQQNDAAYIADSFGNERDYQRYTTDSLKKLWIQAHTAISEILFADGSWENVAHTRQRFFDAIEPIFKKALGVTLRPVNEVTLWHHCYATASLHKALVAEGVLRQDFKQWQDGDGLADLRRLGLIRFRLLGIRWDWAGLARTALEPVVLATLAARRAEAVAALKQRIEIDRPVGNAVYEDDDGVVFVVPGFYEGEKDHNPERSEELFKEHVLEPLGSGLDQDLRSLGAGTEVRIAWTVPRLYLTDFPEVIGVTSAGGPRERLWQVDEVGLKTQWRNAKRPAICPSCGLRPGRAAERGVSEAKLESWRRGYCETCRSLAEEKSFEARGKNTGIPSEFRPEFDLSKIRKHRGGGENPRLALLSVQTDPAAIATGAVLATQVARPPRDINNATGFDLKSYTEIAECFEGVLEELSANRIPEDDKGIRKLIGDKYWLSENDGRVLEGDHVQRADKLIEELFLREDVPDELVRQGHEIPDRLTLFALRKHASPGRLQRIWDDLRGTWREMLEAIGGWTSGHAAPLSLDVRGLRVVLSAADLRDVLKALREGIPGRFSRINGRFPLHISVTVFREKFPLYIALDSLRRMEGRIAVQPSERWTLEDTRRDCNALLLTWKTEHGGVTAWRIPLKCADPEVDDLWYPNVIRLSRPRGPDRLVHMTALEPGDQVRVRPMTFDYAVLDGSARRHRLRYDGEGYRPHYILGAKGRRPYLLEDLDDLFDLVSETRWTPSHSKAVVGHIIECYEKWVRDAPGELREEGRSAWLSHSEKVLRNALPNNPGVRARLVRHLEDGLFFDTFDWNEFVEKGAATAEAHGRGMEQTGEPQ